MLHVQVDACRALCGLWVSQVYTVGPDYAHAEARKSPALDGKVERDSEGKEIRYPVMLTSMEKLVARKVCMAFKVSWQIPGSSGADSQFFQSRFPVSPLRSPLCVIPSKRCAASTSCEPTATPTFVTSTVSAL